MSQEPHTGPGMDWSRMVSTIHERSWHRRHHSPSLLLARRERMWRLLERQAPVPGMPDADWSPTAFDD